MGTSMEASSGTDREAAVALGKRLFLAVVEGYDVLAAAIGDRLGYYAALDASPQTPESLAEVTGASTRYGREWLEQQAMSGFLLRDGDSYSLAPGAAEVLCRPGTTLWLAPMMRDFAAAAALWSRIADAVASGSGLTLKDFGPDMIEAQADLNAAQLLENLPDVWLETALPHLHARMDAGEPVRVADIGCGGAWAAISLARRFPSVAVDGYDVDPPTVELARANVEREGLRDRVKILNHDVATGTRTQPYDLVMAFECIHDMSAPVDVLAGIRRMVRPDGHVLIADLAGAEEFAPDGDPIQRALYGFSLTSCLLGAMSGNPEYATGAVMRPSTMDRYAREAGFRAARTLGVEHDLWRFYELMH